MLLHTLNIINYCTLLLLM